MAYLLFGGGLYMVLMGIVLRVQKTRGELNRYLTAIYVSTGLIVLYAWAERTRIIYDAYLLYNMQIPLCYFSAPLLYFGFSQITDLKGKPASFSWPYIIPAAATVPVILAVNALNADAFSGLPATAGPEALRAIPAFLAVHCLGLGSNLYILFFLALVIVKGSRFFRVSDLETLKELRLLLFFIGWYFADILLMMVAHLLGNQDLLYLAKFLSSATLICYSFYSFRYPEYTQQVVRKARQLRYRNTQLRGLDTDSVLERLGYLMKVEKAFRDMELSLASLSAQLMVTPHQLSEILNKRLKASFSAFLNDYRVEEAKRLLVERPEASIIEVAFEVGFSSKASFNSNFLRLAGMNPSDFRKKNLPSRARA